MSNVYHTKCRPWGDGSILTMRKWLFLAILLVLASGCAASPPPPPERPRPIPSFAVEFTPAGAEVYPPTDVLEVKRYRTISHWGDETQTSGSDAPSRPYIEVGQLYFPFAWHFLEKDVEWCAAQSGLIVHHVRRVGGHAVLQCEVDELARGYLYDPPAAISYRAITLDVIRWAD